MSSAPSTEAFSLTQDDVRRLLNEPVPEARIEVAKKIASGHASGNFKANELLIAEQIFRLLIRDTEVRVRAALAEKLKSDQSVPRDIIRQLATDAASEVSVPVLESAESLDDQDLVDIIKLHNDITKHIAIANRRNISSMVSAALVETENEQVVTHLVKNDGAQISEHSMKKIVHDFAASPGVVSVVVQRSNLPVTVVENLLSIVSDTVANDLKKKYASVARKLEEEAQRTRENLTLKLLDTTTDAGEVQNLVDQLYSSQRLTPSIILTSLCRGNFVFFETSLARMAGIPAVNARKLINDKGDLGFKSLYKKAGLPDSMFDASRFVLEVMKEMALGSESVRPGTIHYANRVVEKLFAKTEGQEVENLAYLIALIRQHTR